MNLIVNAIDALQSVYELPNAPHPDSCIPTLAIRTELLDAMWVKISIKDNGIGMTEDVLSRLFDPFFTTKPIGQGTGLGLSICYQIVEKHGGKIYCASQPQQGAEFVVEIPVQQNYCPVSNKNELDGDRVLANSHTLVSSGVHSSTH